MMASNEITIDGEPIPGDDLGPVESGKWWKEAIGLIQSGAISMDKGQMKMAEWWDRRGAQHMKWGCRAAAYTASAMGVTVRRFYQVLEYGRARWHLCTTGTQLPLNGLTEKALRPVLDHDPSPKFVASVLQQAHKAVKAENAKRIAEGKPAMPEEIKPKFIKDVMREVAPKPKRESGPREKPYTPSILTSPLDDLEAAIEAALEAAARVRCSPTVPELLRRALSACRPGKQGVLL